MPLTIRRGRPEDAPLLAEFNRRLARESEGKDLDPGAAAAGVRAALADPARGAYFLAERDGEAVGQLMITREWSDWRNVWMWWISSVYVHPDARRQGVFRALYDHVVRAAREEPDVGGLRLYVERENRAAQQTYLSLGMRATTYEVLEVTF